MAVVDKAAYLVVAADIRPVASVEEVADAMVEELAVMVVSVVVAQEMAGM